MSSVNNQREIREAQAALLQLDQNIEFSVNSAVDESVDNLIGDIERVINEMGLVGDPSDKPGQPPLVSSFKSQGSGSGEWLIYSTAEHAMAIEEGADPHPITPNASGTLLSWIPENPGDYPSKKPDETVPGGTWYDPEKGVVFSTGVQHPGNDGYGYIDQAQTQWWRFAQPKIGAAVDRAIITSGFRPAGRGGGGLNRDPDFVGGP